MQVSCSIFLQVIITDAYSVIYGYQIEKSHSFKNLLFVENKKEFPSLCASVYLQSCKVVLVS